MHQCDTRFPLVDSRHRPYLPRFTILLLASLVLASCGNDDPTQDNSGFAATKAIEALGDARAEVAALRSHLEAAGISETDSEQPLLFPSTVSIYGEAKAFTIPAALAQPVTLSSLLEAIATPDSAGPAKPAETATLAAAYQATLLAVAQMSQDNAALDSPFLEAQLTQAAMTLGRARCHAEAARLPGVAFDNPSRQPELTAACDGGHQLLDIVDITALGARLVDDIAVPHITFTAALEALGPAMDAMRLALGEAQVSGEPVTSLEAALDLYRPSLPAARQKADEFAATGRDIGSRAIRARTAVADISDDLRQFLATPSTAGIAGLSTASTAASASTLPILREASPSGICAGAWLDCSLFLAEAHTDPRLEPYQQIILDLRSVVSTVAAGNFPTYVAAAANDLSAAAEIFAAAYEEYERLILITNFNLHETLGDYSQRFTTVEPLAPEPAPIRCGGVIESVFTSGSQIGYAGSWLGEDQRCRNSARTRVRLLFIGSQWHRPECRIVNEYGPILDSVASFMVQGGRPDACINAGYLRMTVDVDGVQAGPACTFSDYIAGVSEACPAWEE
ncbi:MAG: hypothetical protein KJZ98_05245 [Burkholderiaceae bacterium]|jgi:hypothetical protein|nr:hypothetical protein [Burkholderiaceae bacterium]MEB2352249.1 hypothetical protein [Burkholderiaceae bacterium]